MYIHYINLKSIQSCLPLYQHWCSYWHLTSSWILWWCRSEAWTITLTFLAHQWRHEPSVEVFISEAAWDCVKLKSLRGRAWMIYAFVISHLLKQSVNIFVPLHQSCLQRQRGKDGENALEGKSKVNQAICPDLPLSSSILLPRCNCSRQSPCDSFANQSSLSIHTMISV